MYTQPLFEIMLSFPVLKERDARVKVHLCAVCPESSGALKGVLGRTYMSSLRRMSVFTAVCIDLAKYKPKSHDMNIIMWLFSHLAWKDVYHIIIFICTACLFIF